MQGKTDFKRGKRLCCGRSILDPHIPGPYVMHSRMLSKFPSPNLRHNSTTDAQSSSHPMSSSLVCKPRKWTRNSSRLTAQQRTKSPSSHMSWSFSCLRSAIIRSCLPLIIAKTISSSQSMIFSTYLHSTTCPCFRLRFRSRFLLTCALHIAAPR